jgi:drug/metabolite transporter (DMT)-like permease
MDACMKWLVSDYTVSQLLFMRTSIGAVPTAFYIWLTWYPGALRIGHPGGHLMRIACALVAMYAFFSAIAGLELATITSIALAAPIVITLFSVFLLREKVGWRRWAAVCTGFAGVLIILRPDAGGFQDVHALLALLAVVAYALLQIFTRRFAATESASSMIVTMTMSIIFVSGCLAVDGWRHPALEDFIVIMVAGLLYGAGFIMLTLAYRIAESSFIAPFDYLSIVWAAVIGYAVWGDVPGFATIAGAMIIIGSGLFILQRRKAAQGAG